MVKRRGGWSYQLRPVQAYGGGVDLEESDADSIDREHQESRIDFTDESQRYPAGEGDPSEATLETELFGTPRRVEGDVHCEARSIVVTIPEGRLKEVQAEEADVARREGNGEQGFQYYWQMGRLPVEVPERIYFLWDGAIRAYHNVTGIDRKDGRLYMDTAIHSLQAPVPMAGFRGFRYLRDVPAGKTAEMGHDLFELTDSDPLQKTPGRNPLISNPSEAYQGDNWEEDKDLHLGSSEDPSEESDLGASDNAIGVPVNDQSRGATNPTFLGTRPADGDWQYVPDLSSSLTTVRDDAGEFASDSDYRSPFVRVYERLNQQSLDYPPRS
jgi:hypothetical protein